MKIYSLVLPLIILCSTQVYAPTTPDDPPQLVAVKKIWDTAPHNAFTDLIRFEGKWFCTFREADGHVRGNGKIRVITSKDGEGWESAASLSEDGIDLRDPKLSVTPDNRLMLVMGGSVYEDKRLKERQPRVAFSTNGWQWSAPRRVLDKGDWLWRVTWHRGRAYGIAYGIKAKEPGKTDVQEEWTVRLVESEDGVAFRTAAVLAVPGRPNEATLRFKENGDCVALVRREGLMPNPDKDAWIGTSHAPYKDWQWHSAGVQVGGPNFLVLPGGRMIASGRHYQAKPAANKTFVGRMDLRSVKQELILPSEGDCSYPGMVWHEGMLWLSYYSTHEGKTDIYFAKVRLSPNRAVKPASG